MVSLLFFITGAIVGSFLNVCIYRMPRSESLVSPGSRCVHCGAAIKWHENIPLLSYLFLRGRCSSCKKPISARYFIVELLTAVLFTVLYMKFGLTLNLLFYLIFVCGLIVATFIDFEHQLIPDTVSFGGLAIGLLSGIAHPALFHTISRKAAFLNSLAGAAAGALSIYVISVLGTMMFRKKLKQINEDSAMGFGDVKFLAMIGAFLGWQKVLLVFFLAPFFGAAVGLIAKIKYKAETIPYGPYLSLAAIVAMLWGEDIIRRFLC
jgi:leader peptidase (prepilin peptidase)/N-methyltransferase